MTRQRQPARDAVPGPALRRWRPTSWEARLLAGSLRSASVTLLHGTDGAERDALLDDGVLPLLGRRREDVAPGSASATLLPFPDRRRALAGPGWSRPEIVVVLEEWQAARLPTLAQLIATAARGAANDTGPEPRCVLLVMRHFEAALATTDGAVVHPWWETLAAALRDPAVTLHLLLSTDDAAGPAFRGVAPVLEGWGRHALRLDPTAPATAAQLAPLDGELGLAASDPVAAPAAPTAADEAAGTPVAADDISDEAWQQAVRMAVQRAVARARACDGGTSVDAPLLDLPWIDDQAGASLPPAPPLAAAVTASTAAGLPSGRPARPIAPEAGPELPRRASVRPVVFPPRQPGRRTSVVVAGAAVCLGVAFAMVWRASGNRNAPVVVAQSQPRAAPAVETPAVLVTLGTPSPAPAPKPIAASPAVPTAATAVPVVPTIPQPVVVAAASPRSQPPVVPAAPATAAVGPAAPGPALPLPAAPVARAPAVPVPARVSPAATVATAPVNAAPFPAARVATTPLIAAPVAAPPVVAAPVVTAPVVAATRVVAPPVAAAPLVVAPVATAPRVAAALTPSAATAKPATGAAVPAAERDPGRALAAALAPLSAPDLRQSPARLAAQDAGTASLALVRYDALQRLPSGRATAGPEVVSPLFIEPLQAWVRADSPRRALHQLAGTVVDVGTEPGDALAGTGALRALLGDRAAARIRHLSDRDALAALQRGDVDAVLRVRASPLAAGVADGGIRALTLDRSNPASARALREYLPVHAGAVGAATETLGLMSFLVVRGSDAAARDRLAGQAMRSLCSALPGLRLAEPRAWATVRPDLDLPAGRPYARAAREAAGACGTTTASAGLAATNPSTVFETKGSAR